MHHATSTSSLDPLLRELFPTSDELRRLATLTAPELVDTLPGEGASSERVRTALVLHVVSRGLVDDLLRVASSERPRRRAEIDALVAPRPAERPPPASPAARAVVVGFRGASRPRRLHGRRVEVVTPRRGYVGLLPHLIELLATSRQVEPRHAADLRRITETDAGLGPRPSLVLHRGDAGLTLRAYPGLVIDADAQEFPRELALSDERPRDALYCPFGYRQEGPKFRLAILPAADREAPTLEISLLAEPSGPTLHLRLTTHGAS
ncbi:MAG: hypothetical protein R3B09_03000 [Nannocystaceae bacterium]